MDRQIWCIADTHWFHRNMMIYEDRPADFTARIIANWQRAVGADDLVIHLGDVILGKNGTLGEIMASLPGEKMLLLGNHDQKSAAWFMRHGFVYAGKRLFRFGVLFSHEPVVPLPEGVEVNVHGHFHRNPVRFAEAEKNAWYREHRENYRLVQIEDSLSPVRLEEVLERWTGS